ncbi:MAG: tyrosine-type recombinase/integrase [Rhizobiales bacterium]|nr:tyrosine-type recombinase/integrase [Hyphomicrobiales bacterium]
MPSRLTDKSIELAKPHAVRREIADAAQSGLYLIVQPSGSKSFAVRFRLRQGAKVVSKKFTLGPALSKSEIDRLKASGLGTDRLGVAAIGCPMTVHRARELATDVLNIAKSGRDPGSALSSNQTNGLTFEDALEMFVSQYAKTFLKSANEVERTLKRTAGIEWAGRSIREITKADVLTLVRAISIGRPIMANRTLAVVRKMFNWLVEQDELATSPCLGIKPPGKENPRERVLSDREVRVLRQRAAIDAYPFSVFFEILLLTGQRRNEVARMEWRELDLEAALWTIPAARSKNKRTNIVPLSPQALAVLKSVPRNGQYVFTETGYSPISGFSRFKMRLDASAHLNEDWVFHDLRRTVATGMARLGVPLPVVEKVLNHVSGSFAGIVSVYQRHHFLPEKRLALIQWADFLDTLSSETEIIKIAS